MAAAFSTFATGGIRHEPFWIRRVEDPLGRVLEEQIVRGQRSLDASIGYQLIDMMRGVLTSGTGKVVRRLGFDLPAAGKTGTSDDFRDAWFTGFTPTLSVSVWVGYDRGMSMRDVNKIGITGGRGAAPIWAEFMIKATNGEPPREFTVPSDIHFETVNPINGEIAGQWVPNRVKVALRSGQIAGAADEPSIIEAGKSGTVMSEQSISEKADQPAGEEPGKSTITEEDLPPE
jgi:penicillin-binding protein 1A